MGRKRADIRGQKSFSMASSNYNSPHPIARTDGRGMLAAVPGAWGEPHTCDNFGFSLKAIFQLVTTVTVPQPSQTRGSLGALGIALWWTEAVVPRRLVTDDPDACS